MNTRSKGPIADSADIVTETTTKSTTMPENIMVVNLKNITSDQKLDYLIHKVTKLTSIPADILDINRHITEITVSTKEIPKLEKLAKETEASLQLNITAVTENKKKIAGIETLLNHTQSEVDTLGKTIKEIQTKLKSNEKSIKMIKTKVSVNEDLLAEREKHCDEMHTNKDINARSILIQRIPEDRNENLKVLVHQVLFGTKIKVPWSETDVIYCEGYFERCRTRPIEVTFVRKST